MNHPIFCQLSATYELKMIFHLELQEGGRDIFGKPFSFLEDETKEKEDSVSHISSSLDTSNSWGSGLSVPYPLKVRSCSQKWEEESLQLKVPTYLVTMGWADPRHCLKACRNLLLLSLCIP